MDNQPTTQVKILEYFKIDQLMQGGNVQRIFAIIGLSSIIDVTKKHKIVNQELFVYAEDSIAEKLSKIIGGTWCKNYTNKSSWNINLHTVGSFFQKLWSDEDHLATIVHHSKMSRAFCGNKRGNISYMRSAMYPRLSIL